MQDVSARRRSPVPHDERFGPYHLAFELASGGMATVYLALHEGDQGPVALKRIHPHLADEHDLLVMFYDEARIASLLEHPNLCRVIDYGEHEGLPYIAMDHLMGEPVSRLLRVMRHAPPDIRRAVPLLAARIVADACEGLHVAHELRDHHGRHLDVVHRDISPDNLFVTYSGITRVLDFGVARAAHRVHYSSTGLIRGKAGYLCPELLTARPVDRRADIWSLGVVLWEVVAGRRLFRRGTEVETAVAALHQEVPSLTSLNPHVPEELDRIVQRAVRRDPDSRYPTARQMARDLELLVDVHVGRGIELAPFMARLFPYGEKEQEALVEAMMEGVPTMQTLPRVFEDTPRTERPERSRRPQSAIRLRDK